MLRTNIDVTWHQILIIMVTTDGHWILIIIIIINGDELILIFFKNIRTNLIENWVRNKIKPKKII